MLEMNDTKSAWRFIREVTFTTAKGPKVCMDLSVLNEAFASTVTSNSSSAPMLVTRCDNKDDFHFRQVSIGEIQRFLEHLKERTATGPDGLPAFLLKRLAEAVAPNITRIVNDSLTQNIVPSSWKKANIAPVWKNKGSKTDASNYRPISVLPVLARMLEKICARQLSKFCDEKDLIPPQQFGFRPKSSCEHALISATGAWMEEIDDGCLVGALLVDLSKAFDTVPHQLLLLELEQIGCSTDTIQWFHSYLTGREQRVVMLSETTDWRQVMRGFPQGSGLSPLLFNVYVRKLPAVTCVRTFQFADDITNSAAQKNPKILEQQLLHSFNQTKSFCDEHQLVINPSKSQLIVFHARGKKLPPDFVLEVDGCKITPAHSVKLLGVTLDRYLTFGEHIDNVVKKCRAWPDWCISKGSSVSYKAASQTRLYLINKKSHGVLQRDICISCSLTVTEA